VSILREQIGDFKLLKHIKLLVTDSTTLMNNVRCHSLFVIVYFIFVTCNCVCWWYGMRWWWYGMRLWGYGMRLWWYGMRLCNSMVWHGYTMVWYEIVMVWYEIDMVWYEIVQWYGMTWLYHGMVWDCDGMVWDCNGMVWSGHTMVWYEIVQWYGMRLQWYGMIWLYHGMVWHLRQGSICNLDKGTSIIVDTYRIIKPMCIPKTLIYKNFKLMNDKNISHIDW
jgi:hypothetical protein